MASALTGNDFDDDDGGQHQEQHADDDDGFHANGDADADAEGHHHHDESPISFENGHLSIVGHDIDELPLDVAQTYGPETTTLNLSFNRISRITNLDPFTKMTSLVLDNNELDSEQTFPLLPSVDTLWVNNNNIADLERFIASVIKSFPNISYISMLKNPACPNQLIGKDQDQYRRYRLFVLHKIPGLKFLDSTPVSADERAEADRVGQFLAVAKPDPTQYDKSPDVEPTQEFAPLPSQLRDPGKTRASFGVSKYVYVGRQSEGNRFIVNSDL